MKACGGCTVCCTLLEVKPLRKAAGEQCKHCLVGVGCKIYESRPPVCSTFDCLWRETPVLGEELRPDKCGVMFEAYPPEKLVVVMTTKPMAWQQPEPSKLIRQMLSDGFGVCIIESNNMRHFMVPPGDTPESLMDRVKVAWRRKNGGS